MRRFADLHTHSTASDGSLSPDELVRQADQAGLAIVALTDHDTTIGLREARRAAEEFPELRFLGGVEVSAVFPTGMLHLLGLGIDETAPALVDLLERLREARRQRNPKILDRLAALGISLTMDDVLACVAPARVDGGDDRQRVVGRLHIAEALRREGVVKSLPEAFDRYIGDDAPAYVSKERCDPSEVIGALRGAGGVAVLAHPPQLACANRAELERVVRQFIDAGLNGLECYHSSHTAEQTRQYLDLARKHDLVVAGGSDFHGPGKPGVCLGQPRVPRSAVEAHRTMRRLLDV